MLDLFSPNQDRLEEAVVQIEQFLCRDPNKFDRYV